MEEVVVVVSRRGKEKEQEKCKNEITPYCGLSKH
jgi:hypothetical protein